MRTIDIPNAVAQRLREQGPTAEARKGLHDLGIEGSWVDEDGYHFRFAHEHRVIANKVSPDGQRELVNIPIDGFTLNPDEDWQLVQFFLMAPPAN